MKARKKPFLNITAKSFQYTFRDKRKMISLIIILALPLLGNFWRVIPENKEILYYDSLRTFIYLFIVNFSTVLVACAWFLTIHRRDFALQIIAMAALFYGIFITFDTLPFAGPTPIWFDIVVSFCIFIIVCVYLYYIHSNYINRSVDYKLLHDGIVHDLHHERFLNEISRIEGIMDIADMDEPYKSLCQKEIAKLKESVTYIADKYSELK